MYFTSSPELQDMHFGQRCLHSIIIMFEKVCENCRVILSSNDIVEEGKFYTYMLRVEREYIVKRFDCVKNQS